MCEIVKEYGMKNINQNKCNNEYKMMDNEVLESTKLSNRIIVSVANRTKIRRPKSLAFSLSLIKNILSFYVFPVIKFLG
jgi:hypothetical protein